MERNGDWIPFFEWPGRIRSSTWVTKSAHFQSYACCKFELMTILVW
jgi:hypothetical protein